MNENSIDLEKISAEAHQTILKNNSIDKYVIQELEDYKHEYTPEAKHNCKEGEYFCNDEQKCKPIPDGYHVMPDGELMKDGDH